MAERLFCKERVAGSNPVIGSIPADDLKAEIELLRDQLKIQYRVRDWITAAFGEEASTNERLRSFRFLEEALEVFQAFECTQEEATQLVEYVFGRPKGMQYQEIGGALLTLAGLSAAAEIDMVAAGELELQRVWTEIDQIRAKEKAKLLSA